MSALPLALLAHVGQAAAQDVGETNALPATDNIDFSADLVTYDSEADIITAEGRVRLMREGDHLAADKIIWDRKTGDIQAIGEVVLLRANGDRLIGEQMILDDRLREAALDNMLVILDTGGRLAAEQVRREDGQVRFKNAIYTPCAVTSESGCATKPSWSIRAAEVARDDGTGRLRFKGARLNVLGLDIPMLPLFSVSVGEHGGATGALLPDISYSRLNGLELAFPYYLRPGSSHDATITPHLYTEAAPAIEGRVRGLNSLGAWQAGAFVTYGQVEDSDPTAIFSEDPEGPKRFRGYGEANGTFQLDPLWKISASLRGATDKTVTRRYDLTRDGRLRNLIEAERISNDSYFSIAGWAFQGLRVDDVQEKIPFALPAVDARITLPEPVAGGQVRLQANSLAILRLEGQDTQRAFAGARWDLRRLTTMGHEILFTAYGRGDAYHTDDSASNNIALYRGEDGWHGRAIGALAAEMRWPLAGPAFGGAQIITPRVQFVASDASANLAIPNEDARSVDLEDSNLFALNRFPGYDRWEDGIRMTIGADYSFERGRFALNATIGESYRFSRQPALFPDGTGLTGKWSDIVGRTRARFGSLIDVTHRYRVDKDNFAVRRNELDLTFGGLQSYVQLGYLRLNRNIDPSIEDLRDKEELRAAARLKFARYWSVFGATVLDLTDEDEDPLSVSDGLSSVRHRLGLVYSDDCLELGVSWKRDYEVLGAFRKGSTFSLQFNLKGFGR